MIWLFVLLGSFSIYLIASRLLKKRFNPYTYSQMKKTSQTDIYLDTKEDMSLDDIQDQLVEKMPTFGLSATKRAMLQQKIDRLGYDVTPEQIRKQQFFMSGLMVVLGLIVFKAINDKIGLGILVAAAYFWSVPESKLDSEIRQRDAAIEREMPELYSTLYYIYRRSPDPSLANAIRTFMLDCDPLFYDELMLVLDDIKNQGGDIGALKEWKKRVPLPVVLRFCDILELRLAGEDNINVMTNFKEEMDLQRRLRAGRVLTDLEEKMRTAVNVGIMIPLIILFTIYFAAQLLATFA